MELATLQIEKEDSFFTEYDKKQTTIFEIMEVFKNLGTMSLPVVIC